MARIGDTAPDNTTTDNQLVNDTTGTGPGLDDGEVPTTDLTGEGIQVDDEADGDNYDQPYGPVPTRTPDSRAAHLYEPKRPATDSPNTSQPSSRRRQHTEPEAAYLGEATPSSSSTAAPPPNEEPVAIEMEYDSTERDVPKFMKNPKVFLATASRRAKLEVSYGKLPPDKRELFAKAKGKEINEFIVAQACRAALRSNVKPEDITKMRWVLT